MKNGYLTALGVVGGVVTGIGIVMSLMAQMVQVIGFIVLPLGVLALVAWLTVNALLRGFGRTAPATKQPVTYETRATS